MRYIQKIRRTNLSVINTEEGHYWDVGPFWLATYRSEFVTRGVTFGRKGTTRHDGWTAVLELKHP